MTSTLGTVEAKLLAQIAEGEPIELGTIIVPINIETFGSRGIGEIRIDESSVRASIANALENGARNIRNGRS
ncbi:hypothetical protein [Leucobacter chironomi]|uniref:hypothetical protein n=1 Tax=Leucobacter chironomi TaxID=491918 RepID=UPI00041D7806|nr:hypothetical protein [Leucobacter chironomi]